MRKNAGFTLIELVAVMLILAILAVVAIPQFVDLSEDAQEAAVAGVAGALSSASTLNYAVEMAEQTNGTLVDSCNDVAGLLLGGALPDGYIIVADTAIANEGDVLDTCQVEHDASNEQANFTGIGVDPTP